MWAHLAKRYGQVYSVKLGQIEAVVVSGYDAVKEVLCHSDFDGRPDGFFFRFRAFYQRLGKFKITESSNTHNINLLYYLEIKA